MANLKCTPSYRQIYSRLGTHALVYMNWIYSHSRFNEGVTVVLEDA